MEIYNFFASANGHTATDVAKSIFKNIPVTFSEIWLLGQSYHPVHDIENLQAEVQSKLWFSYRRGFSSIGGTGPKTDKYWGCMLRCGQMVMAQALICRHLGRGWKCEASDPVYRRILKMFQDRKKCPYSIHQIAQMGVSEGKAIGQWFGPNTVAQVLRKLSVYDEWSSIAVHVAFDNAVIMSDIRSVCRPQPSLAQSGRGLYPSWESVMAVENDWRPMLLFIPLRLGLSTFNHIYTQSLKNVFKIKQSLGILGGRPRHAMWLIGCAGDDVICFDPHVTQSSVNLDDTFNDTSYHIPFRDTKRLDFSEMDPSLALCFFLESEADFKDWCQQVKHNKLVVPEKHALFELMELHPPHLPPLQLQPDLHPTDSLDYFVVESHEDPCEEDFESLGTGGYRIPFD